MSFNIEVEKKKFRERAKINSDTYATDGRIGKRTRRVFSRFARTLTGRGDLPKSKKEVEIKNLVRVVGRKVIHPLLSSPATIAGSQAQFDEWHRKSMDYLKARCPISWRYGSSLTVGMVQKIINLHCKDLWALDLVPESYSRFFHFTIDKVTLEHLLQLRGRYTWTKLDSYEEYMQFQLRLRQMAKHQNIHPLALECWNWNANRKK
ncbi:MAG: hypothetical protein U9Q70_02990 [Chloroflexota bacterium]|nr:hypothetical protein [Chloroflexota bacterium]